MNKLYNVKLKTCYASPSGKTASPGEIIEVDSVEAKALIDGGYATSTDNNIDSLSIKEKQEILTKAENTIIETAEDKKFKKKK